MRIRQVPRGRATAPKARCAHEFPVLVQEGEKGHRARCLGCLAVGPERPTPEAARQALRVLGARVADGL